MRLELATGGIDGKTEKLHTDKNKIKFFVISREIQSGAVAKSYMGKYFRISSYIGKPFLIYDFATVLHSKFPYR